MRLYSVTLAGYRRFASASMNLDGRLIAIVGPNEAGKSSLLEALASLNDDSAIPGTALSRDVPRQANAEVVVARFRLTEEERHLSPTPLRDEEARWLIVAKTSSGVRRYRLDPPARRNRAPRESALRELESVIASDWFRTWSTSFDDESHPPEAVSPSEVANLIEVLDLEPPTLPGEVLDQVSRIAEALQSIGAPSATRRGASRLASRLDEFVTAERLPHPSALTDVLKPLVPVFVSFDGSQRDLRSEYNLGDAADFAARPLRNLARMAELPLEDLRRAIQEGDVGQRLSLEEKAQRRLADSLRHAWRQSPLTVSFDREGTVLRIAVSSFEDEYFSLGDRSAGLRMFLALRAFLSQTDFDVPPVLLVDEAETHLHYDAQADLVRVFEQQDDVAQVIYTTHSIGCLPQDLGRGVRVVSPGDAGTRSTIENVWCRAGAGVSPLVMAMGANTIPLAPSRYVVITEGATDAMLLPSILREACGLTTLDFQIVAGLSEASDSELRRLETEAPRVAYLVDGDQGGANLSKRLRGLGVPARKIVRLSAAGGGVTLEDLIHPALYVEAANAYLGQWPPHVAGLTKTAIRGTGRSKRVEAWCAANGVKPPSKLRIAEEILGLLTEPNPAADWQLADAGKAEQLRRLHQRILAALGMPAT